MEVHIRLAFLLVLAPLCHTAIVLRLISSINIPYKYDGVKEIYGIEKDSVEQSAYDADTGLVYTGGRLVFTFKMLLIEP